MTLPAAILRVAKMPRPLPGLDRTLIMIGYSLGRLIEGFAVHDAVVARTIEIGYPANDSIARAFVEGPRRRVPRRAAGLEQHALAAARDHERLGRRLQAAADASSLGRRMDANPI